MVSELWLRVMARHENGKEVEEGSSNHGGCRDALIDVVEALRLQVQRLDQNFQHCGEHLDVMEHNDGFGRRVNHHHQRAKSEDSNDSSPPHSKDLARYRVRDRYDDGYHNLNLKVDIPEFKGKANVNDFLDRLNIVERAFEFHEAEHKKVKLVALKLRKHASFWWENLKR